MNRIKYIKKNRIQERMKDKETKGRETGKGITEDRQKRDGKREDEG